MESGPKFFDAVGHFGKRLIHFSLQGRPLLDVTGKARRDRIDARHHRARYLVNQRHGFGERNQFALGLRDGELLLARANFLQTGVGRRLGGASGLVLEKADIALHDINHAIAPALGLRDPAVLGQPTNPFRRNHEQLGSYVNRDGARSLAARQWRP